MNSPDYNKVKNTIECGTIQHLKMKEEKSCENS